MAPDDDEEGEQHRDGPVRAGGPTTNRDTMRNTKRTTIDAWARYVTN